MEREIRFFLVIIHIFLIILLCVFRLEGVIFIEWLNTFKVSSIIQLYLSETNTRRDKQFASNLTRFILLLNFLLLHKRLLLMHYYIHVCTGWEANFVRNYHTFDIILGNTCKEPVAPWPWISFALYSTYNEAKPFPRNHKSQPNGSFEKLQNIFLIICGRVRSNSDFIPPVLDAWM